MTKEIIQDTKLIAEYLGGKVEVSYKSDKITEYSITGKWVKDFRDSPNSMQTGGMGFKMMLSNCKFHLRFDWLMIVVQKIRDTPMIKGKVLNQTSYWENIAESLMTVEFDSIYIATVTFLKWYNKNKP